MNKTHLKKSFSLLPLCLLIILCVFNVNAFGNSLLDPQLRIISTVTDVNGDQLVASDVVEYTFTVTSIGEDTATGIVFTDTIPTNTTYVAGSMKINGVSKTDANTLFGLLDDEADYNSGSRVVTMRLGSMATNVTTICKFQVRINAGAAAGTAITNQASTAYAGLLIVGAKTTLSDSNPTAPGEQAHTIFVNSTPPLIQLTQSVNAPGGQISGADLVYTSVFTNTGGSKAQDFSIIEPIPANTNYKLNSITNNLTATGLTVVAQYSNSTDSVFTYTPVSGGGGAPSGYDNNVKFIRLIFFGQLSNVAPNNTGTVTFTAQIR
jgi:large repetitive protein